MKILAIDASTKSSGIAVFENKKLVHYECIQSASTDLFKRIRIMTDKLKEITAEYKIEKVILEEVRPENGLQNIKTQKALMYLQGAIEMMLHDNFSKVETVFVQPNEWRKQCGIKTGAGVRRETLKPKDIAFVQETYGLTVNDDIADAIGIGHSYVNKQDEGISWE